MLYASRVFGPMIELRQQNNSCWISHVDGSIKSNVDAHMIKDGGARLGVVARNHEGKIVGIHRRRVY